MLMEELETLVHFSSMDFMLWFVFLYKITPTIPLRTRTCGNLMPGSLGYEYQDAKTFASWVPSCLN
jgi:hypothetical protein